MTSVPLPPPKDQITYVVVPHPDDEFSAWALVEALPGDYLVFILCTQGEQTAMGDGHGLEARFGEIVPQPQPFTGKGTANLKAQRVYSWHGFLDTMAASDPHLASPVSLGTLPSHVGSFDLRVGASTARAVFDLGDGQLTPEAVTGAIQAVRNVRERFEVATEHAVIGAAYYNAQYPDAVVYTHPDHRAVHVALWGTDQGTPGPQWGRTAHTDPDAAARGRTDIIDAATYGTAMSVDPPPVDPATNPTAMRTGAVQRWYGWLAFEIGGYWPGDTGSTMSAPFNRSQTFWERF